MAQLIIATDNPEPQREAHYPRTWFLNTHHGKVQKLAVTRIGNQPRVKERSSAA